MQAQQLKNMDFFKEFTQEELETLCAISLEKKFDVGAILITENQQLSELYFLLEGEVTISRWDEKTNRSCFIQNLGPGHIMGGLAFYQQNASATVKAAIPTVAMVIPFANLYPLKKDNIAFYLKFSETLFNEVANLLRLTTDSFVKILQKQVELKTAEALHSSMVAYGAVGVMILIIILDLAFRLF